MVAAEFQQERSTFGLGASEVAAAIGLNPYETAFELWLRKVGEKVGEAFDKPETEPMKWGNLLEPVILDEYGRRCEPGVTVKRCVASVYSAETVFARATPDAWRFTHDELDGVVQIKNVGGQMVWKWRDAPPEYVQIQVLWELYVTGLQRGDVAALLGGNEFRVFTVWRDDGIILDLIKAATAFWRHVETRIPPATDESDAARDYWIKKTKESVIVGDKDIDRLARMLKEEKSNARLAKQAIKRLSNSIVERMALAGANVAETSEGVLAVTKRRGSVSWKEVADSAGLTSLGEQFRGPDTAYLRSPRDWGSDDDE